MNLIVFSPQNQVTDTNRKLQHEGKEVRPVYLLKKSFVSCNSVFMDYVLDLVAYKTISSMWEELGHYVAFPIYLK